MLQQIKSRPKIQILLTDTSQRSVAHSRRYWVSPTKSKLGKSFELVNDQRIEKDSPITKTPTATRIIGTVPMIAERWNLRFLIRAMASGRRWAPLPRRPLSRR